MIARLQSWYDAATLASWRRDVHRIQRVANSLASLSDAELKKKSLALKYEALSGAKLDDLTVEAFALVSEAAWRTIQMRHYPVQLLGGLAMHHGSIAVMQTGEGKTLTATLPLYLAALTGRGSHLATANDYLAERDATLMTPIFQALGMKVGCIVNATPRHLRRQQYQCDVTYSTAKEIGFDFLRDRLALRRQQHESADLINAMVVETYRDRQPSRSERVQRQLNFMLVDEADSILIDEARTPLVISSAPDEVAQAKVALYQWAAQHVKQFVCGDHFELDEKTRQVDLTVSGRALIRRIRKPELLRQTPMLDIYEQVEQAIFVEQYYFRDRQYVVQDGEIVIVDEFTGRLADGRKWRSGLHQAIEAREGLQVSVETGESARITIQDLFLRYERLAGMTGTAANSGAELRKIYRLRVVQVPTNKPPQRQAWADGVYRTEVEKWDAIADEVVAVQRTGRPVLVGTRSIDKSEILSSKLSQMDIQHDVLNANNLTREAEIVAQAGQVGRVTVATNMAGRGTDIKICDQARQLGGMHVICSEIHESARIDRQLIGRCGRQGDPGTFRLFFSLEDEILENGLKPARRSRLLRVAQGQRDLSRLADIFRRAQQRIEQRHFRGRKMLLFQEKRRHELQREMGQDPYLDTAGAGQ